MLKHLQSTSTSILTNPDFNSFSYSFSTLVQKWYKPDVLGKGVFNLQNPIILNAINTVWCSPKVHKIKLNAIQTSATQDWNYQRLAISCTSNTAVIASFNNLFDVGFGNPVIVLQNQLKRLINSIVLNSTMFLCNNLKGVTV